MPVDGTLFGFRNVWYGPAVKTAEIRQLEPRLSILLVNSLYFCASKLEAFHDRGWGDYLGSRDLEDVIAAVDGRQELLGKLRAAESDVRSYIAHELRKLYDTREFQDPDAASQERIGTVLTRLGEITALGQ